MDEPERITPDDKDWTWVIDRPCPECGYGCGDPRAVAGQLRGTIDRWRAVLARTSAADRPSPQVWSPLEYACHSRDVCRVFGVRANLMLTHTDPSFANWDQDATAVEERYFAQNPLDVADEYAMEAERTAEIFERVPAGSWERTGVRSNGSRFTVATLATYFLHDIVHHLHDVAG